MTLFSAVDLGVVLEEIAQYMERELERKGVYLKIMQLPPLPKVQLDLRQFRSELQRAIEFFSSLLPRGGQMEIEAGLSEKGGEQFIEVGVATSSASFDVFRPFLQVSNYHASLGLELAREVIRRYRGRILFRKENPQQVAFTILLKVR